MMNNEASVQSKPPEENSVLKKAILEENWALCLSRLETNPDEAKVVTANGGTCLLEVAEVRDTPVEVIQKLVDIFPEALCFDDERVAGWAAHLHGHCRGAQH